MKSSLTAYILWCLCFFGLCGIHRFYAGRVLSGLLWLFTAGLFGIGQLIDLFLIPDMIALENLKARVNANRG
jgi:TM2 domain-containing membrane protein YozV